MAEMICINASKIPFKNWHAGPDFDSFLQALNHFIEIFAEAWEMPASHLVAGFWHWKEKGKSRIHLFGTRG